jgi:TPR repeat protein
VSEKYSGFAKFNYFGMQYANKKQYDKTIAWFLLAATKDDACGCSNMGEIYHYGLGVPVNYLCALKWYLKSAGLGFFPDCFKYTGIIFEHGQGVPRDKYKALEWYSYAGIDEDKRRLNSQGIYLPGIDESEFTFIRYFSLLIKLYR